MSSEPGEDVVVRKGASRRDFLKKTAMGGVGVLVAPAKYLRAASDAGRFKILAILGDTIIPSKPGNPGFKDLEPHGITEAVNKSLLLLTDQMLNVFNQASGQFFQGRTFVELSEDQRAEFLRIVIAGERFMDKSAAAAVKRVYRLVRLAVLNVFYSNFPEHKIARDAEGIPIPKRGDLHQITTPNTKDLVTGWDIAGYRGPLTWEQEDKMRTQMQRVHWHDDLESLIVRYRPKTR
ncbi:MAG: twin-arginine translocation signal domain-containing protein [Acidobacteria bacterium]|nr:twin-arginine translocation signal domain-containing protein [Acidobacteriota bacterium]